MSCARLAFDSSIVSFWHTRQRSPELIARARASSWDSSAFRWVRPRKPAARERPRGTGSPRTGGMGEAPTMPRRGLAAWASTYAAVERRVRLRRHPRARPEDLSTRQGLQTPGSMPERADHRVEPHRRLNSAPSGVSPAPCRHGPSRPDRRIDRTIGPNRPVRMSSGKPMVRSSRTMTCFQQFPFHRPIWFSAHDGGCHGRPSSFSSGSNSLSTCCAVSGPTKRLRICPVLSRT